MESENELKNKLCSLKVTYNHLNGVLDDIWSYYPVNIDFANLTKLYKELTPEVAEVKGEINKLEMRINSFN